MLLRLFCQGVHGVGDDLGVLDQIIDGDIFVGLVLADFITGEEGAEGQQVGDGLGVSAAADADGLAFQAGLLPVDVQ